MTNLSYSQVEGIPGSRSIIFFSFFFNYPILITKIIYLSTIPMFDFFFFYIYLSSFIYLFPYLFILFIYFIYLFIYLFISY